MDSAIKYAKSGEVHIAYRVMGEGSVDLVVVPAWVSHLEASVDEPRVTHFVERLASFSRLILFDKRGTGLSDPVPLDSLPTLEQRMEDLHAVLDAVESKKTALFGLSEGGPMSALFAATYPERVSALVMYGSYPRWIKDQDYPWGLSRAEHEAAMNAFERYWGTPIGINAFAPSVAKDESCQNWWARMLREGASPGAAIALYRMNIEIDIWPVLPTIRVPTLLLHRTGDRLIDVGNSRYMAERIPNAKFVELEGIDHMPMFGDSEAVLGEIQEFVTGLRPGPARESALATILFVDIVRSTEKAAALGDARWHALLAAFYDLAKLELERFRGRLINTMGDAVFASFDGPARAIRCACSIRDRSSTLGLMVRAGLHTGECEIIDGKIGGMAVHIGARVAGQAQPGEVIVSSTTKDLVAGSGLRFSEAETRLLKGVPGEWRLYRVA